MSRQLLRTEVARRAALRIAGALAGLAIAVAIDARSAAGASPGQAVVFDGSPSAANTYLVALTAIGLQADLGLGGFVCSGASHISPGGVWTLGPAQTGVALSASGLGANMGAFCLGQPEIPPASILAFEDDCDVATGFATAQSYLAQSVATAQGLVASTASCLGEVEATYCDVLTAVEAATIVPGCGSTWEAHQPIQDPGASGPDNEFGYDCFRFQSPLVHRVPECLNAIASDLAHCQDKRARLLELLAGVSGALCALERDLILAEADADLSTARDRLANAQAYLALLESIQPGFTLAAVESSCAECSGTSGGHLLPSSAISLATNAGVLQVLAGAFENAALATTDPGLAARLDAIAARMRSIPAARVLHLTHPSAHRVGSHHVALRGDRVPDDGVSPLAVVISPEAPTGPINLMDHHIIIDAWRAFASALDPAAPRPDDEDDDNDGVRDLYETHTGRFLSSLDTGSDPNRADTDGDLFFDGTEVAAGSDPNDSGSIPGIAVTSVPSLTPRGLALQITSANPAREGATLRLVVPRKTAVRLAIYDVGGRLVRELAGGLMEAGEHELRWDGRDAAGRASSSGLYFARLGVEGHRIVKRLIALR